jgi:hypothetical protein
MATLSSLFVLVNPDAPGTPDTLLAWAVRQAAIDFMRETDCYVVTTASTPYTANNAGPYTHVLPTDLQLGHIVEAYCVTTTQGLDLGEPGLNYPIATAMAPTAFLTSDDPTQYSLWPTPTQAGSITYRYSLYPTQTATTLPDAVVNQYGTQIATGAKAKLLRLPAKSFTNEKLADQYETAFRSAINHARVRRGRSFLAQAKRVAYQFFGA